MPRLDRLDKGKIGALVKILRGFDASPMRCPTFRAMGLFICYGVIEAGRRTAIGARLKQSGVFRTVAGANSIIALRCCRLSNRFEDYRDLWYREVGFLCD